MILVDLSHTSHSPSQSGVQQVCRQLFSGLLEHGPARAIVYDPFAKRFRFADPEEQALINPHLPQRPPKKRKAKWSLNQKIRGCLNRFTSAPSPFENTEITAILAPEIIGSQIPLAAFLQLQQATQAPLHALFHDLIALKLPDQSPAKTVAYFPKYLEKLGHFDAIAAVSKSSLSDLDTYFSNHPPARKPHLSAIPLGTRPIAKSASPQKTANSPQPKILCVASIEGRKNHLELLNAAQTLWKQGLDFELELIGVANPETAGPALQLIQTLQHEGRSLIWRGPATPDYLDTAYRQCAFTVYPSPIEGFGIPPLESLSHGKPCICSNMSGLAETANGGGCLVPRSMVADEIADAIRQLLTDESLYERLCREIQRRPLRTWNDYAQDVSQWLSNPQVSKPLSRK